MFASFTVPIMLWSILCTLNATKLGNVLKFEQNILCPLKLWQGSVRCDYHLLGPITVLVGLV